MQIKTGEAALRERYRELSEVYWQHSIQLLPDLVAKGGKTPDDLNLERTLLIDLLDLHGRSVIDIGSWTGYHAFEAKRAGASRVIATDKYAWNEPAWRGRETFELARDCLGLDVEAVEIDPTELPGALEPVDVVMFFGVFYHMHEPVTILKKVCALARDVLVIETHQDLHQLARPAMAFYPGTTLNGDPSNWWGPNPECMAELLESVGFPHVFYQEGRAGGQRGYFHAFRSSETAKTYMRRQADNISLYDLCSDAGRRAVFGKLSLSEIMWKTEEPRVSVNTLEDEQATTDARRDTARVTFRDSRVEVQRLFSEWTATIAQRDAALAELQSEIEELTSELAQARADNVALLNSTSWRITAPIRLLSSSFRILRAKSVRS